MREWMAAIAATGLLAAGSNVGAQAPAPPGAQEPQSAPAHDAGYSRRMALVRRYFTAVNVDGMTRKMMDNMLPAMLAQQQKTMPSVPPQVRQAMMSSIQESLAAVFPRMMDRMGALYADNFTELELQKLVDFYESPDGRRITAKNSLVVAQSGPLMGRTMADMQADFMQRFCGKVDCSKAKAASPKAP